MEGWGVKARVNPLSVVVVVAVVAAATGVVTANRNNDRLYSSLHELTNVLREGFNSLAGELKQERASRDDFARALKTEMLELRRAVKAVCRGVRYLGTSTDDVCVDEPPGNFEHVVTGHGTGHGAGHGVGHGAGYGAGHAGGAGGVRGGGGVARGGGGGSEPAVVRGSSRPTLNVHDKSRSRDAAPPTAPPPPDPMSCPPPYHRTGSYCLMLLRERVNWEEARVRCHRFAQSRGAVGEGDLAVVDDMDTFKTFVADTDFREAPSGMALVGGSADGWGGAWVWVDGSLIKQLPWLYSQTGHEGTVLAVDRDGIFHTIIRRTSLWPLCQIK